MIDLNLNKPAVYLVRIAVGVAIAVFLLRMFKQPIVKILNFIKVPKQYIAMFAFLGKYKIDIAIVILLLLLSLAYTQDMNFDEKKPTEQAELVVETFNNAVGAPPKFRKAQRRRYGKVNFLDGDKYHRGRKIFQRNVTFKNEKI